MPSEKSFPAKEIRFALGTGRNLGKAQNISESYTKFRARFKKPLVTAEKYHEYKLHSDKKQAHLKSLAGWFMRARVEKGKRTRNSIKAGDLITLDADYATPEWVEWLTSGDALPGITFFCHSTRSSIPEKPRLRIAIPLSQPLPSDDYQAACRITAKLFDPEMQVIDKVSARVAQMMYMPTVCSDMEKHYVFYEQEGELHSWKRAIAAWEKTNGSASDIANLPRFPGETELRESALKAEDPLEKDGLIGTFCRTYSITELVTGKDGEPGPLAEDYEITEWHEGVATRMTYLKGSTSNGAVVYDDKFVYSHHGSDPAQDRLLNAYDLVRYHLFDALGDDEDDSMREKASVKSINKWVLDEPNFKIQRVEEDYDADIMFDDDEDMSWMDDDDGEDLLGTFEGLNAESIRIASVEEQEELEDLLGAPLPKVERDLYQRRKAKKPPKNWIASELSMKQDGSIESSLPNVATIVTNDPRFFQKVAWDAFRLRNMLTADIKTKSRIIPNLICRDRRNGVPWDDYYNTVIRAIIESENGRGKPGYGLKVSDRDLVEAIKIAGRNNSYHPVKDFFQDCRDEGWDGVDRISDFLHRHVGAEKNQYTADVFRTKLMASIARVDRPGCKFDYAIILEGAQGIGKSTFIKLIYGDEYFGEVDVDLSNRQQVAEQLAGKWALELPELSALQRGDHNAAKAFMRRQNDDVRMAYGRESTEMPRQCVLWGTTNDNKYLKDPTGNRSYWPVLCGDDHIDFLAVMKERKQLWAQALIEYDQLAEKYPESVQRDLPLTLKGGSLETARGLQEKARTQDLWESWRDKVLDWVQEPIRKDDLMIEMGLMAEDEYDGLEDEPRHAGEVTRVAFTQAEALKGALEFRDGVLHNHMHQLAWGKVRDALETLGYEHKRCRIGGKVGRWIIIPGADEDSLRRGFCETVEAEPRLSRENEKPRVGDEEGNGEDLL